MRIMVALVLAGATLGAQALPSQRPPWRTLSPRPSYSDSIPDAALASIPMTVAAAEAEGRAWPRRPEPGTQISTECAHYFADAVSRNCRATSGSGTVR